MRTSALNQCMQSMDSSSRRIPSHPSKTESYSWDPRVSVIRKELVDLTGDSEIAVVLNQLLYWSQRLRDYDLLVEEEKSIPYQQNTHQGDGCIEEEVGSPSLGQYGWFYKSTSDLIEETHLCVSRVTMRRYLNVLLERGWIQEKGNSQYKWDRTTHYRVNLYQLDKDLKALGYGLPGFILEENVIEISGNPQKTSMLKNEPSMVQNSTFECKENHSSLPLTDKNPQKSSMSKSEPSMVQNSTFECKENDSSLLLIDENRQKSSMLKNEPSMVQNSTLECEESEHSNVKKWSFITENKTENTNREHRTGARTGAYAHAHACEAEVDGDFDQEQEVPPPSAKGVALMVDLWRRYVNSEAISLTDGRKHRLESLLELYFQADLRLWESFCLRVKAAPFLMGQGKRKWQVTLDWILLEENLLKVLEGNFDDEIRVDQEITKATEATKKTEIKAVFESIEDPVWRKLCSQLDFSPSSHEYVTLGELKAIANARFVELEDDRLVWIGCSDSQVLSHIENLRLKLLTPIKRAFPQARNLRTRLEEKTSVLHPKIPDSQVISTHPIHQHQGGISYAQ